MNLVPFYSVQSLLPLLLTLYWCCDVNSTVVIKVSSSISLMLGGKYISILCNNNDNVWQNSSKHLNYYNWPIIRWYSSSSSFFHAWCSWHTCYCFEFIYKAKRGSTKPRISPYLIVYCTLLFNSYVLIRFLDTYVPK